MFEYDSLTSHGARALPGWGRAGGALEGEEPELKSSPGMRMVLGNGRENTGGKILTEAGHPWGNLIPMR